MRPEHEPPINIDIENVCVPCPLLCRYNIYIYILHLSISMFCTYLGEVEVEVVPEVMSAATAALLSISRHSFC